MTEHTASIEIDREEIDAYFDALLAGNPEDVLHRITLQFLPRRAQAEAHVLDLARHLTVTTWLRRTCSLRRSKRPSVK